MAIKQGVSLYSYQDEFYRRKMTLEDCIRAVSESGATGIEILPEQMIKGFPNLTDAFLDQWFEWMDTYHVEPVAYDAFLELKLFGNRMLTHSESVEMMKRDITLANKLGCTVLRTLVSTPLDVIKDSEAFAEEKNVKIALEVHSPFTFGTPWFEERLAYIKESGTKWFGIMPDLGIFVKRLPPVQAAHHIRLGAHPDIVAFVDERYESGADKQETLEMVKAMPRANDVDKQYATTATHFCFTDPKLLAENIDCIMHVHGKCYDITDACEEPSIPYLDIVRTLKDAGYDGYIDCEYEGNRHIQDVQEVDSVGQVNRFQRMLANVLSE